MGCTQSVLSILEPFLVNDQQQQPQPSSATPSSDYGKTSPIYKSLPNGAQKFQVRNVYDGDTLTLVDERRVRFLGIDTPELKEKQPFAEEAKEYTKARCHKKEIYLVIDGEDHYGRLLCHVFVQEGNGYLCVNEGLVAQGYAYAYTPKRMKLRLIGRNFYNSKL